MVGNVDQCVDPFETYEVMLNPFTKGKILNIDMVCMRRGLLSIAHCRATIVVFVSNGHGFLWDIEVPEYTTDKEGHAAEVTGGHKFSLCRREGNCWLKLGFVGNCAASKLDAGTTEEASSLDACSPIGIAVCNNSACVMIGAVVK